MQEHGIVQQYKIERLTCRIVASAAALLVAWGCVGASSKRAEAEPSTVLVRDRIATATIVAPVEPDKIETLAVEELRTHIKKITNVQLPFVTNEQAATGMRIYIGRAAPDAAASARKIKAVSEDPASFRLLVTDESIQINGLSSQGTLFATYELLEQLGVRWFVPGDIGIVIPEAATVAIRHQDTIQHPGFSGRTLSGPANPWYRRVRLGGFNCGGHGPGWHSSPQKEPHLYMTENGRPTGKLNVAHPEVLRRTVEFWHKHLEKNPALTYISVGPYDGLGFGEHPWDAGDMDPLHGRVSVTDRYVKFFHLVLAELRKQHPDVGLGFYCYSQHMRPPVREKPDPKILPILAPIDICRFHAIDNPICWERQYIKTIVDGWHALGVRMMYRGYLFNLADAGLPFSMIRQIRAEYPYYHKKGMIACRVECKPAWSYHGPSLYLAAKIMWDPTLDVDALLDDYFARFYGPAGDAMRKHFDRLERAYAKADYHTGNTFDIPHILTSAVMRDLEESLRSAEQAAAPGSVYAKRVRMTRIGFDFGAANLKMMAAVNNFDFVEAKKQLDLILNDLVPTAFAHKPILLSREYGRRFIDRFWTRTVTSGYERATNGNEIAAKLPDEWLFIADPYDGGEALGLWKPHAGTQSWSPLKTYSQSWSNQGLRYYKAEAWYRTRAQVDERFRGRPIRLWLGGIDDTAQAWINGTPLKLLSRGAAPIGRPWEFDATEAIRYDRSNVIVVKVSNRHLNELGTGGITGPAMLWAQQR